MSYFRSYAITKQTTYFLLNFPQNSRNIKHVKYNQMHKTVSNEQNQTTPVLYSTKHSFNTPSKH